MQMRGTHTFLPHGSSFAERRLDATCARRLSSANDKHVGNVIDAVLHPKAEGTTDGVVCAMTDMRVDEEYVVLVKEPRRRLANERLVVHEGRRPIRIEERTFSATISLPLRICARGDILNAIVATGAQVRPPAVQRFLHHRRKMIPVIDDDVHGLRRQLKLLNLLG